MVEGCIEGSWLGTEEELTGKNWGEDFLVEMVENSEVELKLEKWEN